MGYDVHLTRAGNWTESESVPITLDEWRQYVAGDAEMRMDNSAEAETDAGTLRYENEGLAVWTAYSGHDPKGNMAWFDYFKGRIDVKNPDDEILEKMKQIAGALQAKVVGDDGEEY
jgi:hypothetical protein